MDFDKIMSSGYAFQIEMTHTAWMNGFRIAEVPITFVDRRAGYSKMASSILSEGFWIVWKLAPRSRFRRPTARRG